MSTPFDTLIQITPDHLVQAWLDLLTSVMVEAGVQIAELPAAKEYAQRLCVIDREAIGLTPGFNVYVCANSDEANSFGDSLYAEAQGQDDA